MCKSDLQENKDFTYRKATLDDVALLVDTNVRCSIEQEDKWDEIMIKELIESAQSSSLVCFVKIPWLFIWLLMVIYLPAWADFIFGAGIQSMGLPPCHTYIQRLNTIIWGLLIRLFHC